MPSAWTTEAQRLFLQSYASSYREAAAGKKYTKFFAGVYEKWFAEFPEDDASGDLTDIEDQLKSKAQRKRYEKEQVALRARLVISAAQAGPSDTEVSPHAKRWQYFDPTNGFSDIYSGHES